jgi:uridine kinase
MKLCFIITGLLRDFGETLFPFLCSLKDHHEIHLYIYTSKETHDFKYLNQSSTFLDAIYKEQCVKLFLLHDIEVPTTDLNKRELNTVYQWYRLEKLYTLLPEKEYDWYIRLRPDVHINLSKESFSKVIEHLPPDQISIPLGNDIFDTSFLRQTEIPPINDQIAFIPKHYLEAYCKIYSSIDLTQRPLISEYILAEQLSKQKLPVHRFYIPYTLCLSSCRVLAIAGDSGSGKSTVVQAIEAVFPFDSSVLLETDRYHKWERHNSNWSTMTHLHPDANNLEKLLDDTYCLKLGKDIFSVDYDHSSGKFTEPQHIKSKDIVLLCGLHTLYQDSLRNHIDIKIYVDTQEELKTFWKLQRDVCQRHYSTDQVLEKIKNRQCDFNSYILPQKDHANVIFRYSTSKTNLTDIHKELSEDELDFELELNHSLLPFCFVFLNNFSQSFTTLSNESVIFMIRKHISKEEVCHSLHTEKLMCQDANVCPGYLGVIQAITLRLLFHS